MNSSIVFLNPLKISCIVFGHSYKISKNVTDYIKEYKCKCCSESFTTSTDGDIIKLTPNLEEINSVLEHLYHRKKVDRNTRLGSSKFDGAEGVKITNSKNFSKSEAIQKGKSPKIIRINPIK